MLQPSPAWKVDHAVLATYSADLVAVVTALLALSGADFDHRRTGSRVEVVRAIEALRGKVRVVAQKGRLVLPKRAQPILNLLDQFVVEVDLDERDRSWHPKAALVRYVRAGKNPEFQWRLWIGSRNLTRSLNWEAGFMIESRPDGKGDRVDGIGDIGAELAARANLVGLSPSGVRAELDQLTWESPPGVKTKSVHLIGNGKGLAFPPPPGDLAQAFLISPFLDVETVRLFDGWKSSAAKRTLVSTAGELNRIAGETARVFENFGQDEILACDAPELPGEVVEMFSPDESSEAENKTLEDEDIPPSGLHAKMICVQNKTGADLWLGSANATKRAWTGKNFEVVAHLELKPDAAKGLVEFVRSECQRCEPIPPQQLDENNEEVLEDERKRLASIWSPTQLNRDGLLVITSPSPPPIVASDVLMDVAPLGQLWKSWPTGVTLLQFPGISEAGWCNLIQVRLRLGEKVLAWVQSAPLTPAITANRDRAVIAHYLEPRSFLLWLRSLLLDQPAGEGGGDWDDDGVIPQARKKSGRSWKSVADASPTVEEILAAWARNPNSFAEADSKVREYLNEMEKKAAATSAQEDVVLLSKFRATWLMLAKELNDE